MKSICYVKPIKVSRPIYANINVVFFYLIDKIVFGDGGGGDSVECNLMYTLD